MIDPATEDAWRRRADAVWAGVAAWQAQHPTATLREIETAVDEHLAGVRARLVQDVALASRATDPVGHGERPACPECGEPMVFDGRRRRRLTTAHDQTITLTRGHARCPACRAGLFPPG
ncbi:MAG: hypothetical protein M3Q71_16415 [Chloroflexota bacterium]|nr:hypothetical protein [Chloroflexota bacterium]